MDALSLDAPITARAAAASTRTRWNQLRRGWAEWMVGRPEDRLIAGLWTEGESRAALYLGLLLLLLLPAAIGLGLAPADLTGRLVLVATAVAALYSASEVEVQRRARGFALLPVIAGLIYALCVSAVFAATLWSPLPALANRHATVFLVFPLLLLATGLRGDPRLTVATGLFSALGFLAVVLAAPSFAALDAERTAELARHFGPVDLAIHELVIVCTTAFAAVNATRERTLRRNAHCDPLTGLVGARTFEGCLEREAELCLRTDLPLTIALLDLDRFRQLNEAHGHAFGDAILRWIADLLRESVRNTDLIARLSGERFCIAFLDSEHPSLVGRLEALRREVSEVEIRRVGFREPVRLTLSAGMARFPREGAHVDEVMAVALERLHSAKRAGRDRVVA